MNKCRMAPFGWSCALPPAHYGLCATWPKWWNWSRKTWGLHNHPRGLCSLITWIREWI